MLKRVKIGRNLIYIWCLTGFWDDAPISVKLVWVGGGVGGRAWGGDLTFFKNWQSNSQPTGKSFQSIATKFLHPRLHIAVKYPKVEPKKGTIKNLQIKLCNLNLYHVAASPKIHVSVTAAIICFDHNPCYSA